MSRSFNLADLFEGAAEALPDQDAVVAGGSGVPTRRRTYAELDAKANQVAHVLVDLGVGAGDHVAVHAMNCIEFMEITMGIFKLRAVPINGNFRYTVDELRYVFDDAEVVAVFTQVGIRNVADLRAGIREMARVTEPGGRIAILEFTQPANPLFRFVYYVYFLILLPILGNLVAGGKRNAYGYLPRSVLAFPDRDELARIIADCGLGDVCVHSRTFGIVTVHVGTRPEQWPPSSSPASRAEGAS